jgi:chemotaxis protein CheZ
MGSPEAPSQFTDADGLYTRVGRLARTLHDALRELGYHDSLQDAFNHLPDARDRLAYISKVTGEAAEQVLNSVDKARLFQERLARAGGDLGVRWAAAAGPQAGSATLAANGDAELVPDTRRFLETITESTDATNAILSEIMVAQNFHDLTGQVVRRVVELARNLEEQLLQLLVLASPAERPAPRSTGKFEGPATHLAGRTDLVADQAAVDELLASLGF